MASLTKRKLDHFDFDNYEKIEIDTLDKYCLENSISHIDLLKIDIEGRELDVLMGAEQLLATKSVDILTFEFGGCNIDTRTFFRTFGVFYSKDIFGYTGLLLRGYMYNIDSYKEISEQFRTMNYMAVLDTRITADATSIL